MSGRGLCSLDKASLARCCRVAEHVDLSHNSFHSLEFLQDFDKVQTLIIDHNPLRSLSSLPLLPRLDTLSLNYNQIPDCESLQVLARSCPSLTHLSLMGNPCCPLLSPSVSEDVYESYCERVAYYLPSLKLLDGSAVKKELQTRVNPEFQHRISSFQECEIGEWHKG